jgi:hypothetical protein
MYKIIGGLEFMDGSLLSLNNAAPKAKWKGISGSTLKLIAIFTMLIDHTAATILDNYLIKKGLYEIDWNNYDTSQAFFSKYGFIYNLDSFMRSVGRIAFPIFCFLLVEGMIHTRNKLKYTLRLALFAILSEIPFDLAFTGELFFWNYQSIYFTLLIGLLVMIGFERVTQWKDIKWLKLSALVGAISTGFFIAYSIKYFMFNIMNSYPGFEISNLMLNVLRGVFSIVMVVTYVFMSRKKSVQLVNVLFTKLGVLFLCMFLAELLHTDYGAFGVLTIAVMYQLHKNKSHSMIGGCITLTIMSFGEITAFIDLLFIRFYNGKRGLNLKYVFYLFYPVHLFVLYLICYFMKLV